MANEETAQLSWLRKLLWPIHGSEQRMNVPMCLMMFLICFNYSILRNAKDALVVTANDGAEVIPFIQVWAMLPCAVLLTLIFTKLCNRFSQQRVFYIMVSGYLCYYLLFLCVLYPYRESLHPVETADKLAALLPAGAGGLVAMFRNWTFTTFYVMSDLWVLVVTVLFWGFANSVTQVNDANRLYAFFNMSGNLAAMLAGQLPTLLLSFTRERSLTLLMTAVIACGLGTMLIFRWLNLHVLNQPQFAHLHQTKAQRKLKPQLSMWESFSYVANSRYLLCIAALVVGYNVVIDILDVVWKHELRQIYPDFAHYNAYLGHLTSSIGVASMLLTMFIPGLLKKFGWTKVALITPVTMLITGMSFFSFLFFRGLLDEGSLFLGTTPIVALIISGTLQTISSKACKYSVFDTTKEMAFIPLEYDVKLKGKAAIDGVGSRLAKSGGSMLLQGLLLVFGTLGASVPCIAAILFAMVTAWIVAVRSIGKKLSTVVVDSDVSSS